MAITKNIIPMSVEDRFIAVSDHTQITAGNVGVDFLAVTLDAEWGGLNTYVTFSGCAQDSTTLDYAAELEVPWEQIEEAGDLYIGVQGFDPSADVSIDTEGQLVTNGVVPVLNAMAMTVPIKVRDSGAASGVAPSEPTPGTLQRVEQDILALEKLTEGAGETIAKADTAAANANSAATAATTAAGKADTAAASANAAAAEVTNIKIPAWQSSVDSLLATGGTYEARISALEAIENTREMTYEQIRAVVRAGVSSRYFKVGDQILVPWTDTASGTQYTIPFDVMHHADGSDDDHAKVTLADGSEVCGMYLQAHYALPFGTSFSGREPFYIVPDGGLAAGTYNIGFGESLGTNVVAGKTYQFTVDEDIPAGYQLLGFYGAPDQAPSNWRVYVFDTAYNRTPLKTYTVSEGSGGASLGEFRNVAVNGGINALQRVAYGYNNWSRSALRQWLNSSSEKGTWWEPQHEWDHAPINANYSATKDGFLRGFTDGFLDILGTVRVQTVGNNNTDAAELFTTDDVFFPPSARQHYFNNYLSESASGYTASGQPWDYWKELAAANGRTSPWAGWSTYPELITYDLAGNHTIACGVWLRSARCSAAGSAGLVSSSGYVSNDVAYDTGRCAPACVIC